MTAPKKYPEFDLPVTILEAITDYLGPRATAALTPDRRSELLDVANDAAKKVGRILAPDQPEQQAAR